jgi:hypothetical protein
MDNQSYEVLELVMFLIVAAIAMFFLYWGCKRKAGVFNSLRCYANRVLYKDAQKAGVTTDPLVKAPAQIQVKRFQLSDSDSDDDSEDDIVHSRV